MCVQVCGIMRSRILVLLETWIIQNTFLSFSLSSYRVARNGGGGVHYSSLPNVIRLSYREVNNWCLYIVNNTSLGIGWWFREATSGGGEGGGAFPLYPCLDNWHRCFRSISEIVSTTTKSVETRRTSISKSADSPRARQMATKVWVRNGVYHFVAVFRLTYYWPRLLWSRMACAKARVSW